MNKFIVFLFLCVLVTLQVKSQISEGGVPPSFKYADFLKSGVFRFSKISVPVNLDLDQLRKEDELNKEIGAPERLAVGLPVDTDIFENAEETTLPDGTRIKQFTIGIAGAAGALFSYDRFYIPKGGKLFIYNGNKTQVLGAYTHNTNPKGGIFSTQIIGGDEFTFEYVDAANSADIPVIHIKSIGYIYNKQDGLKDDIYKYTPTTGRSASCMRNINCEEGNDWQDQKRGVVHFASMFTNGEWYICSGSLINNAKNDGKPYVLSAEHCFYTYDEFDILIRSAIIGTTQFYFNYEYVDCLEREGIWGIDHTIVGAEEKVRVPLLKESDGMLILLNNSVPEEWKPYYNGWDATGIAPEYGGVVIHHPNGDVKKISTYRQTPENVTWNGSAENAHWEIGYADTPNGKSVTAGGSSGAPMFNNEGYIVGTLTGGSSVCGWEFTDFYGKFWYHFNQSENETGRMKTYLDPDNTGILKLQGYDPAGSNNISVLQREERHIIIFPNIISSELNVNTKGVIEQIDIYDTNGKTRYSSKNLKSSTVAIQAGNWENGIYFVKIKTENGNFTEKIVKR